MMQQNMDKLEVETNEYVERRSKKKKKGKKKDGEEVKELQENNIVHETGSSNREQKHKESELEKINGKFVEGGESNKIETLEKESMMESSNGKKKKKNQQESELNEAEESKKFKTLEKEGRIETSNGKKKKKKKKETELEEAHKEFVEYEDSSVENKKKNKLPRLDEEQTSLSTKKKRKMIGDIEGVESSNTRKKRKIGDGSEGESGSKKKTNKENNDMAEKDASKAKNKKINDESSNSKPKRVAFSSNVEVFPINKDDSTKRKIGDGSEGESGSKKKTNKENNDMAEKDASKAKNKKINDESSNSKPKRVAFSSNVEVFPINKDDSTEKVCYEKNGDGSSESIYNEKNNFAGKRFSPYEDQLIRDAVQKYIDINQLGEDGIEKIINCGSTGLKGCWIEISKDLPWRNRNQVYFRGRLILHMSQNAENRGFSEEDIKKIMDFHAQNGPKWNELASDLKKNRLHIKDAYRRRRLQQTLKRGKWSQDEYQNLFDLVHQNICAKIYEKNKNKNPMTRDGIAWEAISERLKTRVMAACCNKWYDSLSSPLVREQKWSDADDYRLLDALYYQEGCCEEDVDWDNLVETRPGEYCQKRWKEMVRHIGEYKERTFRDQINLLKERYDINMLRYVEALKNKNRKEESDDEEENEDEHDADKDREEE